MNDRNGPAGPASEGLYGRGQTAYTFTLLFLLYLFDYADRSIVGAIYPFLKAEWGLSDTRCALLSSAIYWSILVFAVPVSIAVDRWSRRKGIALMAGLWSLATGACAFAGSYPQLLAAKSMIGIGEAGYAPGGTAMLSALFPAGRRAFFMGLWNAAIPLGTALGMALGGIVAARWGWRSAFGLVALPGLAVAILFWFVRDYRTPELHLTGRMDGRPAGGRMSIGDAARHLLSAPSLWLTYLGFAGNTFVTVSLMNWLPTFFHRVEGLPMDQAGPRGGLVLFLAIVGAPFGGWLADRWQRRRPDARLLLAGCSTMITAGLLAAAFVLTGDPGIRYGLLLAAGVSAVAFVPAAAAVTQEVVHPGLRATSYSLCVIVMHLLGSAIGPLFVGAVSDRHGIQAGLSILPAFTLAASAFFLIGSRFHPRDAARIGEVRLEAE